jgi:hypothetical protein
VFRPKPEVRVELIGRLPKGLRVPNDLADRRLIVGLQQAFEGGGDGGHRLEGDMVSVNPLQIGQAPP